mgnify:CR=1 FL=1
MSTSQPCPYSYFENDLMSVSLDHVTWVEKKRDGAVTVHFPGSDTILLNKVYGPPFMQAYMRYHQWKTAISRLQTQSAQAAPAQRPTAIGSSEVPAQAN